MINFGGGYYTSVKVENIVFQFDFEAGKEYTVGRYTESTGFLGMGKTKVGIAIWDTAMPKLNGDKSKAIKSWELGEVY